MANECVDSKLKSNVTWIFCKLLKRLTIILRSIDMEMEHGYANMKI